MCAPLVNDRAFARTLNLKSPKSTPGRNHSDKEEILSDKILITFATRTGSTSEIATTIGQTLIGRGFDVDVKPIKENPSPIGYQAVVIGSGVRFGSCFPEALKYVEQHHHQLNRMPTAFFCVHMMNMGGDETSRKGRLAYLAPLRKLVTPCSEAYFAGIGDLSKITFIERMVVKAVKPPLGDFRDWDKIQAWAQSVFS
jgi:menaquinone-dependent protoporphyrinogen oxidase